MKLLSKIEVEEYAKCCINCKSENINFTNGNGDYFNKEIILKLISNNCIIAICNDCTSNIYFYQNDNQFVIENQYIYWINFKYNKHANIWINYKYDKVRVIIGQDLFYINNYELIFKDYINNVGIEKLKQKINTFLLFS